MFELDLRLACPVVKDQAADAAIASCISRHREVHILLPDPSIEVVISAAKTLIVRYCPHPEAQLWVEFTTSIEDTLGQDSTRTDEVILSTVRNAVHRIDFREYVGVGSYLFAALNAAIASIEIGCPVVDVMVYILNAHDAAIAGLGTVQVARFIVRVGGSDFYAGFCLDNPDADKLQTFASSPGVFDDIWSAFAARYSPLTVVDDFQLTASCSSFTTGSLGTLARTAPSTVAGVAYQLARVSAIPLLSRLVAIPSLVADPAAVEQAVAAAVDMLPADVCCRTILPTRDGAHVTLGGAASVTRSETYIAMEAKLADSVAVCNGLVINGHIDVVPVESAALWRATDPPFSPFSPTVTAERLGDVDVPVLVGRGAGDMKGGLVAAIIAARALRVLGVVPRARLDFHVVSHEEDSGAGTAAVLHSACMDEGFRPAGAVIPEPFFAASTVQPGVIWVAVDVESAGGHVLSPKNSVNAITAAVTLFQDVSKLAAQWQASPQSAIPCPQLSFNLGTISGGSWTSSIPCTASVSFRGSFPPSMTPRDAQRDIIAAIDASATALGVTVTKSFPGFMAPGCLHDSKGSVIPALQKAAATVTQGRYGVIPWQPASQLTCTTDVRHYEAAGISSTCFGPKAYRIHGADECVDLASVHQVAATLAVLIASWCGLKPLGKKADFVH